MVGAVSCRVRGRSGRQMTYEQVEAWLFAWAARVEFSKGRVFVYWHDECSDDFTCSAACSLREAVEQAENDSKGTVRVMGGH